MSPITINLDGVEAWKGGAVLPVGTHTVRCTDAEEGRSSGGHFEIHLTWEALDASGTIQDWVQITETTLGKVRQLLEATRIQIPSGEFTLEARPFLGATAEIVVREKPKQDGSLRNEIVAYNPPGQGSDVPGAGPGEFQHPAASTNAAGDKAPF